MGLYNYGNRPHLSDKHFQQCTTTGYTDTLHLSGATCIVSTGILNSDSGYQISGHTILTARGTGTPKATQIGYNANSQGSESVAIGFGAESLGCRSISIGCGNIMCSNFSTIIGGVNNVISTGNTDSVFLGFNACTDIPADTYTDTVVVPSLAIITGAGDGKVLTSDASGNATWGTAGGTSYWSSGATGLSPINSCDNISLTPDSKITWSGSNSCIYSTSGASFCALRLLADNNYDFVLNTNGQFNMSTQSLRIQCGGVGQINFILYVPNPSIYPGPNSDLNLIGGYTFDNTDSGSVIVGGNYNGFNGLGGSATICGGYSCCNTGGDINFIAGCTRCTSSYTGRIKMTGLPTKSTETDVVYIDGSGNLSCGAIGGGSSISGENITKVITQASHGFVIKDVIGWSGGTYNKAIADGSYDGEILGIVTASADTNTFSLTQAGYVTGLTSLVQDTTYFLSDATAGLMTSTEPTGATHISKSVLVADSTTTGWVLPYAGYIITSGSTLSPAIGYASGFTDNNIIYYSCDTEKLTYKDPTGGTHTFY